MSSEIKDIIQTKKQIYEQILELLEKNAMIGGSNNSLNIDGKINIMGSVTYNGIPNHNDQILNKLSMIKSGNKLSLSQAALSSFDRIKKNK